MSLGQRVQVVKPGQYDAAYKEECTWYNGSPGQAARMLSRYRVSKSSPSKKKQDEGKP